MIYIHIYLRKNYRLAYKNTYVCVVYIPSLSSQFYQDELGQERLRIEQEMQVWKPLKFQAVGKILELDFFL